MNADLQNKEQLLCLENDDVGKEEDTEDVELEEIDVATQEKKNRDWVVLEENWLEVVYQYYDSQVVECCERHGTQELASVNFICNKL